MNNLNFEFIKDDSNYFYEKCCQVDLLIAMGLYEKAIASSRKVIECIVNPNDEGTLLDFLRIHKYDFSRKTLDYLHDIRKCGNKAVHPNRYRWTKHCADVIARKMHHVVITELYKKRYQHDGIIDEYVPIDETNEWFLNKIYNPKFIKHILKSADEDYLDVMVKEEVTRNMDELREEFNKEIENTIKSYAKDDSSIDDLRDEFSKELEVMVKSYMDDGKPSFIPNQKQKEAIQFWREENNNLIIKAGPGSGKTSVLVERVKFLINEKGVDPKSILLITFTEKAANELKERLCGLEGLKQSIIDQIHVSTIHGFCRSVLKKNLFASLEIIDDENNEKKVMFIKNHKSRLGLDDKYSYVPNNELKDVAKKFDEMDTFQVNPDDLIEHLESQLSIGSRSENRYKSIIDKNMKDDDFPVDSLSKKQLNIWESRKFLAIIKAYKEYKDLIQENNVFDFNRLQSETRNYLIENRDQIRFTNILIDEFQDTDSIQMDIFNLLQENSESITYVGDQDQSIFSWRGSNPKFFDEFTQRDDFKLVTLNKNYRSSRNIVDFNEFFMSKHRRSTINFKVKNEHNGDLFYMNNDGAIEEVDSIVEIIKFLRDNNRIKTFSDIAIISNSVVYKNELFNALDDEEIPYTIKGLKDFKDSPEVKAVLTLIWYLTKSMNSDEINLKTFCNSKVNDEMFNFHEDTLNVLNEYEDCQEFSLLSESQLKDNGIHENDLEFFTNLNHLKANLSEEDELTILDIYYQLLKITDYIESKYEILSSGHEDSIKNKELLNLSLISHKIKSYMDMNDEHDLDGLFEYLIENYQDFSSPLNDIKEENRVHILTSHKAKGLEFPIVIVCSLCDEEFPKEKINNNHYKIPFNFLYPDKCENALGEFELAEIERQHLLEEQIRVLYVSLTRAESCLILSTKGNSEIVNELSSFEDMHELSKDTLDQITFMGEEPEEKNTDLITLSFTSMQNYNKCSHSYNLSYNYNFITPQNESMHMGSIAHDCLDAINTYAADDEITDELVDEIIQTAYESNPSLESNDVFEDILESVGDYYDEFIKNNKWKVLQSEYPFTIYKMKNDIKYNITGKIDLIIQEDEDNDLKISLVDYKSSSDVEISKDYLKQLHIYAMAMEYNPEFEDKEIEHLIIYSLTDTHPDKKSNFNIDTKNKIEKELYETANSISHYKFSKTNKKGNCHTCAYKEFCK